MSKTRIRNKKSASSNAVLMDFGDNSLLAELYGEHDQHLALIEERTGATISTRGNRASIAGTPDEAGSAKLILRALYDRLKNGLPVAQGDVEGVIRLAEAAPGEADLLASGLAAYTIRTKRRSITPRSARQAEYIQAIRDNQLVFAAGPAGTGKTYLAVAQAVTMLLDGSVDRLILSRPAVEAGESIGFLPGDMREKVDPYLRPLYDALHDMLPGEQVVKYLANGDIEVAPLGFMRGRTLSNSFIILDEAQNTTPVQMKMFLTRLGENSNMVICGDPSQVDLPLGAKSGLREAMDILAGIDGIASVRFGERDVVRHRLVTKVVQAYNKHDDQLRLSRTRKKKSKTAALPVDDQNS